MPDRWTPPTLHTEMVARRRAKGDVAPVANRPMHCGHCQAPGVAMDMLADLRPLAPAAREALGVDPALEWVCTGCLGTAFNTGRISHHELFTLLGASPEALSWAREHTAAFPYASGSWAHAAAHALASNLPSRSTGELADAGE